MLELTPAGCLLQHLAALETEVVHTLDRRERAVEARDEQPGQGLFISAADVAELLEAGPPDEAVSETGLLRRCTKLTGDAQAGDRLAGLASIFGLEPLDLVFLLAAVAPDVDRRFETLFAFLNDDVTCRRPTIGLCLELAGASPATASARARFRPEAPLLRHRLLALEDDGRSFPARLLRVPDRVVEHLLGSDVPDPAVRPLVLPPLAVPSAAAGDITRAARNGVRLFYLRGSSGPVDHAAAAGALASLDVAVLEVDLSRLMPQDNMLDAVAAVAREAAFAGCALVAGPIDEVAARDPRTVDLLASPPSPVLLLGHTAWEPAWTETLPLIVDVTATGSTTAVDVWSAELGPDRFTDDLRDATSTFRLTPHQALRAAWGARTQAAANGTEVDSEAVRAAARAQNGGALERLARRVSPRATFDDLVLPDDTAEQIQEIVTRARLRDRVIGEWGMAGLGASGTGITALFAGPSGTGKTLAAEVTAHALGLDLYVVDLASVVSKYIGETEKNLDKIFDGAQGLNGVLFFDEADALFGKRAAVTDGHDRYANIEVAYLLQRMEQFDGLSILATNLTSNLDDAFTRRIDLRIVFAPPEAGERRRLWERHLPAPLPVADDVDLDFLATKFRLAGGNIRNVALAAAYDAARTGGAVNMAHLVRATAKEYRKLGRLCTEEEFGPYLTLTES